MTADLQNTTPPRGTTDEQGQELALTGPVRTCVACRGRDAKQRLVRLVAVGGRIALDPPARKPGRGAYVHPRKDCVERVLGKGNLGRALRTRLDPAHTTALRQSLLALLVPPTPGNLATSGEPAAPGAAIQASVHPPADLSTCSPASTQRMPSTPIIERTSRPSSEITSANPAPVGSDRATHDSTRPAPPFVVENRQARGQR